MRDKLRDSLASLSIWAESRRGPASNPETTISLLERRVAKIREQVYRAGRAAALNKINKTAKTNA